MTVPLADSVRQRRGWAFSFVALFAGCATPGDSGTDCMERHGGYGGADLDAIAAECVEGGGTCCEPAAWIELDAALCFSGVNPDQSGAFSAKLDYLDYLEAPGRGIERVVWGFDDQVDNAWQIDACDGSLVRSFTYEPR